jgi:hypothetical protein
VEVEVEVEAVTAAAPAVRADYQRGLCRPAYFLRLLPAAGVAAASDPTAGDSRDSAWPKYYGASDTARWTRRRRVTDTSACRLNCRVGGLGTRWKGVPAAARPSWRMSAISG